MLRRTIDRRNSGRSTCKKVFKMVSFGSQSVFVFGICLVFYCAPSVSILPLTTTQAAANDCGLDRIGRAVRGGGREVTSYEYDSVPWQPNPSHHNIDEATRYEDMPPSVFSPTGRLHPVEAAVRASKAKTPLSNLLVAMVCKDGLLVVSTLPISPNVDARIEDGDDDKSSDDNEDDSDYNSGNDRDDEMFEASPSPVDESAEDTEDTNSNTIRDGDDDSLSSSLLLFDETCTTTATGPIFDIHPCIVGATAGNAVDNRIMRTKLLALGLNAFDHQGCTEQDISTARVAKDLANQLQVTTQDIAAAQRQRLGRILACSAVLLGSRQIWRVDPTGQFWNCHASVLGEDADKAEDEFYRRLLEECESNQSVPDLLASMSQNDALALVKDFLETRVGSSVQHSKNAKTTDTNGDSEELKSDDSFKPHLRSQLYWQATILDYSSSTKSETPRRKLIRGIFSARNKV